MHEMGLIGNIIDIVLAEMSKHHLTKIQRISLRIGEMRQVVPEAMQFGFECLSKNTPLENAELAIESVPLRGHCLNCNAEFKISTWLANCSKCQSNKIEIISGKELEIVEFEGI